MATLNSNVHVTDAKGVTHVFGPADEVPTWAQALITNPKAWAEPPVIDEAPDSAPAPAKKAPAKRAPARRKAANGGTGTSG
ncbi:hypothetical protein [Streptomyces asiaticus]|uniref:hypothetical protein n=1 Tax=Streptomyces asiaticus TaxID=114695 RepID=UPI001BAE31E1|nr:hypothetical protein [Streptomyces asiaticus]